MFLPVEVARLVERERRRELERRLPWLVALREQRAEQSQARRPTQPQVSTVATGPRSRPQTGPVR